MMYTSFITLFLGLWLVVAPATLGYSQDHLSTNNSLICGMLLILSGWFSRDRTTAWAIWLGCLVGLWLQFAPLVFWAKFPASYTSDTFVGLLAILFTIIIPGLPNFIEKPGPTIPPGWSYNPSSYAQRFPIISLAIFGWFASRYLAAYQLGYIDTVWDPFFGNGTLRVITSTISQSFPVPDAGLGALAYSLEALLGCKGGEARWRTMPWLVIFFGLLVVPVGITSIILIILQPLAVGAWCGLCLMIALSMLIMVALTLDELVAVMQLMKRTKWQGFWTGCSGSPIEQKNSSLDVSLAPLLQAGLRGCSFSWNLALATLSGLYLIIVPFFLSLTPWHTSSNQLIGPLVIATSFIATAEVARRVRWLLIPFGLYLLTTAVFPTFSAHSFFAEALPGSLLFVCSLFQGTLKERYG